jgi:hypothetical protein
VKLCMSGANTYQHAHKPNVTYSADDMTDNQAAGDPGQSGAAVSTHLCHTLLVCAVELPGDEECRSPHDHEVQEHRHRHTAHIAKVVEHILCLRQTHGTRSVSAQQGLVSRGPKTFEMELSGQRPLQLPR